jgi:hypothetical protein
MNKKLYYNPVQVYEAAKYIAKHNSMMPNYVKNHDSIMNTLNRWEEYVDNDWNTVSTGGYFIAFGCDGDGIYNASVFVNPAIGVYDVFEFTTCHAKVYTNARVLGDANLSGTTIVQGNDVVLKKKEQENKPN